MPLAIKSSVSPKVFFKVCVHAETFPSITLYFIPWRQDLSLAVELRFFRPGSQEALVIFGGRRQGLLLQACLEPWLAYVDPYG